MLNSEKKIALCATKKNKYSNSRVVRKKILNETKNHSSFHFQRCMENACECASVIPTGIQQCFAICHIQDNMV